MTEPLLDPDCRDRKHRVCAGGPCQCPCHEPARPSAQVVAQMAVVLAFIAERHRPDFTNGTVQALTCRCCSQTAGIPVEWPCPDRQAVGRLLEDPTNRLLPPEPPAEPARPSAQVVAQMAVVLAFIAERHRPDFTNGTVQALTCRCCSQTAGIPVEWPCPDRQAVGRLLEDPTNRLLPPEPPAAPPTAGSASRPRLPGG